ncbi:MAG: DUF1800 domain-containing protein [Akkermansiaceae bacterium]|nr:DUF1800 domain-containing protein [Akkermansiaceae bacterium]
MVKKLWEFFVKENPSAVTLDQLTTIFQQRNFSVAPVLREIFLSKEFYEEATTRTQIKCPVQYLVALLKQLEIIEPPVGFPVVGRASVRTGSLHAAECRWLGLGARLDQYQHASHTL